MPLFIPDGVKIYEADLDNLARAVRDEIVPTGLGVTAQAVPNMSVQIALGDVFFGGARVPVGAVASLPIDASDPANPRIDLVCWTSGVGIQKVTGVAAGTPKPPALPASSILLAYVSVGIAAVNIQNSNITDRRWQQGNKQVFGTLANRPSAALFAGMTYIVTDGVDGVTYYFSTGAAWTQTSSGSAPAVVTTHNLVLNGDFGRRTTLGTAMPGTIADINGYQLVNDAGADPTVATNRITQNTAGNEMGWPKSGPFWRDSRKWIVFKAVSATGVYKARHKIDATHYIEVRANGTNFEIYGNIGAGDVLIDFVAQTLTLNRWYWFMLETQKVGQTGGMAIGKLYDALGGADPVTVAASTLLQTLRYGATNPVLDGDAQWTFTSDQATCVIGGLAAQPGGVYVEILLPESFTLTFGGTADGQAFGFDESVDAAFLSGAHSKQWACRVYNPRGGSGMTLTQHTPDGSIIAAATYTGSMYIKVAGKAGAGNLVEGVCYDEDSAAGNLHVIADLTDGGSVAWTRKTGTNSTATTARRARMLIAIGFDNGGSATGTGYFTLAQLEQGAVVTAWRAAPADDAPIVIERESSVSISSTSTTLNEPDPRDLAFSFFLPYDCVLDVETTFIWRNSGAGNGLLADHTIDGVSIGPGGGFEPMYEAAAVANNNSHVTGKSYARVLAGKHRVAFRWRVLTAGSNTMNDRPSIMRVTAFRGK